MTKKSLKSNHLDVSKFKNWILYNLVPVAYKTILIPMADEDVCRFQLQMPKNDI